MAITKIHPITTTLTKALNYIQNPKKTDGTLLVDSYGCVPETAYQQFMRTKEKVDKKDGYLAFHMIQSFSPGEVDYETAHKIGIELADKVFKGRFQYVIATHIDRGNVHNHIIANSVSFKDFGKYNSSPNSYYFIRRTSDMLCNVNPSEYTPPVTTTTTTSQQEQNTPVEDSGTTYVLNTNSKKIHYASCSSVDDMKESNKAFTNDYDQAIADGYKPCGRCKP